jgi:hypothetical protein
MVVLGTNVSQHRRWQHVLVHEVDRNDRALLASAGAFLASAPPAAQASAEHPRLLQGGEERKTTAPKVPAIAWGQLQWKNTNLGSWECVNLAFGTDQNETEPGGVGNSEKVRAYGEVLGWSGTAFTTSSGLEALPRCKSSTGFVLWAVAEPRPSLTFATTTNLNGAATERGVIVGPFGSTASHREPPSMPWRAEAEGTENTETHIKTFWVKIGIAISPTERAEVEAEEAAAGVPTERRTGCYHNPLVTEIVREPGFSQVHETELALRSAPQGCIRASWVAPEVGVEIPFTGTLEPEAVNGTKNGLSPSNAQFKGGFVGTEEHSSERNERELVSAFGPWFARSITAIKQIGYLHQELLTLK